MVWQDLDCILDRVRPRSSPMLERGAGRLTPLTDLRVGEVKVEKVELGSGDSPCSTRSWIRAMQGRGGLMRGGRRGKYERGRHAF